MKISVLAIHEIISHTCATASAMSGRITVFSFDRYRPSANTDSTLRERAHNRAAKVVTPARRAAAAAGCAHPENLRSVSSAVQNTT